MPTPLERRVNFIGAFDFHRPDPSENYGVHNMEIVFAVIGPKGAVNLSINTGWFLPHVAARMAARNDPWRNPYLPWIFDVGMHSRTPIYPDSDWEQEPIKGCCLLNGDDCYYDGTGLWGDRHWREGFLHGGTEWLWPRMEQLYYFRFEDGPEPDLSFTPRKHPKDE